MTTTRAIDRFLVASGLAEATTRAYASDLRDFAAWYGDRPIEDVDVRLLADWTAHLGAARRGGKLAPATISRRLAAVRSLLRFTLGPARVPDVPSRRATGAACRTHRACVRWATCSSRPPPQGPARR